MRSAGRYQRCHGLGTGDISDNRKCQLWERERQTSISKIWVWAEFQDACLPAISRNSVVTKTPVRINTCTPYRQPGSRLRKQAQVLIPKERWRLLHQLAGRSGFLAVLPVVVWSHPFEGSPVRSRIQMQATEYRTDFLILTVCICLNLTLWAPLPREDEGEKVNGCGQGKDKGAKQLFHVF